MYARGPDGTSRRFVVDVGAVTRDEGVASRWDREVGETAAVSAGAEDEEAFFGCEEVICF